jgi:hypothetical protein
MSIFYARENTHLFEKKLEAKVKLKTGTQREDSITINFIIRDKWSW